MNEENSPVYITKLNRNKKKEHHASIAYEAIIKANKYNKEPKEVIDNNYFKREKNDRGKLKFDWDPEEDTSNLESNYYSNVQGKTFATQDRKYKIENNEIHWSLKDFDQMRERDWRIFKEDFDIVSIGKNCPNPLRSWEELEISDMMLGIIIDKGFDEPTPIQRQSIPIILKNRNLIGISSTGSGKTFSFVLPVILKIMQCKMMNIESFALILAPNREIVNQIDQAFGSFIAKHTNIRVTTLTGGFNLNFQTINFINGTDVLIATPNRLVECIRQHFLDLHYCNIAIFDEIDRLLEDNYKEDFELINSMLPGSTQKIFFSATLAESLEKLLVLKVQDPLLIKIRPSLFGIPHTILQKLLFVDENSKLKLLLQIIRKYTNDKILIFCNTKIKTISISNKLATNGIESCTLHGDSKRRQRESELLSWKANISRIMISTDMTSRGLDIEDLDIVLNYDMPLSITQYIHRIGRTGRVGRKGLAITFINESSSDLFIELKKIVSESSKNFMDEKFLQHHACNEHTQIKKRDQKIFAYGT